MTADDSTELKDGLYPDNCFCIFMQFKLNSHGGTLQHCLLWAYPHQSGCPGADGPLVPFYTATNHPQVNRQKSGQKMPLRKWAEPQQMNTKHP